MKPSGLFWFDFFDFTEPNAQQSLAPDRQTAAPFGSAALRAPAAGEGQR